MARLRKTIVAVLLCFALVSVGFAIGKEATLRRLRSAGRAGSATSAPAAAREVVVYYMYPTVRCISCNRIEAAAQEVVSTDFAAAVRDGRLRWQVVNIHENDDLARRYGVAGSTVVVVSRRDGRDDGFRRLDEVWPLADRPDELRACIRRAVTEALDGGGAG